MEEKEEQDAAAARIIILNEKLHQNAAMVEYIRLKNWIEDHNINIEETPEEFRQMYHKKEEDIQGE
jgi:hypothetical protein